MSLSEIAPVIDVKATAALRRRRLAMLAFSCHPHETMEDRNGWHRAIQAAGEYDVTVFTAPDSQVDMLYENVPLPVRPHVEFHAVSIPPFFQQMLYRDIQFYVGYRKWLAQAKRLAQSMHQQKRFDASHLVSICGYREPGYMWELDIPFVWGPVGGTCTFPWRYLSICDWKGGAMEVARNLVNLYQLRFSRRIRRGMNRAAVMLAANRATQSDLERSAGIRVELDLETGIDFPISPARPARDSHRPFRILWVGRLRTWKGLPLLLHAIAQLPTSREVELRVVGEGNCRRGWQKLASDLGIANRIEWLPRLPYRQSLQFYRWADAFAFTSLRDTSGTGLLESLACGLPIMGLNHQGAADIMTDQCAVRITVASPRDSIAGFVDAIERLAGNSAWHKALSDGALDRAREYAWNGRYAKMSRLYERAIQNVGSRTGT